MDFFKATWDHIPKPPKVPPSLIALKCRRAWLAVRPTYTYGDHRDKVQRDEARKARRQLALDEAWVRHEKKKQERAKKKQDKKDKAALASSVAKTKPKPTSKSKAQSSSAQPKARSPAAPIPVRSASKQQQQKPRVVYLVPQVQPGRPGVTQAVHTSRPVPQSRPSRQQTAPAGARPVVVQPWGPIQAATHKPGSPSTPRVARATTYPIAGTKGRK